MKYNEQKYIDTKSEKIKKIIKEKSECIKKVFREEKENYKWLLKPILIISIIFIISISAIIRADFNYRDDLGRVAKGYIEWGYFSRFVSVISSIFLHADTYLTDISPLPQLLAACIMACACVIILYVYKNEKKFTFWNVISVIPLGLSPYFLECFSYKYDAPYMALSVLASVIPLLFEKKGVLAYSIAIILGTLVMCMTYQAASGIFMMFVLLICLKKWNEGSNFKEVIKFLFISAINFVVGLLIFKFFIMRPVTTYVSNSLLPLSNLFFGSLQNLRKYFSIILTDFKKEWLLLLIVMVLSCIYSLVRNSKQNKIKAMIVSAIGIIIIAVMSFGIYPALSQPLFYPRAMYGFGMFIVLTGIVISNVKKAYLSKFVVFLLAWSFISFSFTYGNALKAQKDNANFRINMVIGDLNDLDVLNSDNVKKLQLKGSIGYSPIQENMPQDYEILNKLVPGLFDGLGWTERYYFYNYFDLKNIEEEKAGVLEGYEELPILKDTMYHTIRGNEERILVEIK